ncbi:hypothetical protein KFK09_020576 [Dendrobium nobile]|uniref:RNase H type-1 domain-containing protein n=1 Tax=Dendrobium nobile TaxID=94219 RepID=A0A8T3AM37_DENNO|nr:hypothetical protein KFK09_020576 [Dendrobium nobile]
MDGAKNTTKAGCHGTIRDYKGVVIKAFASPFNATTTIQAELESLLFVIRLCNSIGITNLWVEVDAMLIIHYINGNTIANFLAKWGCNLDSFVEYDEHNLPKGAKGLARLNRWVPWVLFVVLQGYYLAGFLVVGRFLIVFISPMVLDNLCGVWSCISELIFGWLCKDKGTVSFMHSFYDFLYNHTLIGCACNLVWLSPFPTSLAVTPDLKQDNFVCPVCVKIAALTSFLIVFVLGNTLFWLTLLLCGSFLRCIEYTILAFRHLFTLIPFHLPYDPFVLESLLCADLEPRYLVLQLLQKDYELQFFELLEDLPRIMFFLFWWGFMVGFLEVLVLSVLVGYYAWISGDTYYWKALRISECSVF